MKTNWPDVEENLRTLLDTWEEIGRSHVGVPGLVFSYSKKQRVELANNARSLMAELAKYQVGETHWHDCMWWIYQKMVEGGLSVGTHPMSMAWGIPEWLNNKNVTGQGCPECTESWHSCIHEWGSNIREQRYGGTGV